MCLCLACLSFAQATKESPAPKAPRNAGWVASEKAVTKLEQEWFRIQLAHDWDKLRQLLGDDFQLIESDGRLGDRDSMIAGYKEEAPSVATISMTLLVSHAVSNDTVVATGLDDISLRQRDGSISHRYERFTDVWILRNNQWVCVAEQITLAHPNSFEPAGKHASSCLPAAGGKLSDKVRCWDSGGVYRS